MPPDLSGRRAEVEGEEERPEIFPSERRQGGGCCGFPNAKSEELFRLAYLPESWEVAAVQIACGTRGLFSPSSLFA